MNIRHAQESDLGVIVALNNQESRWVGGKTLHFFRRYLDSNFFYVAEDEGKVAGFVLAMDHKSEYTSPNFRWFKKRLLEFVYVDRMVVEPRRRSRGIGTQLHEKLLEVRDRKPIVGEISTNPKNEASLRYHENMGFEVIGSFSAKGHTCAMYILT